MNTAPHYHNTLGLQNTDLAQAEEKALTQEEKVLELFGANPLAEFTPADVHRILLERGKIHPLTPITSIRRAISNLTHSGKLLKTTHTKPGVFNIPNLTWKLANTAYAQGKLF